MAVLLITHDLGIVAGRADRVAVMYAGQIVEEAPTAQPVRPAVPSLHPGALRLGAPAHRSGRAAHADRRQRPAADAWPSGCRFRPRCPKAFARSETMPPLLPVAPEHRMRCWLAEDGGTPVTAARGARPGEALQRPAGSSAARSAPVRAVDGVSFEVARGETLALVGESGCGKSSVGRTVLRLQEPTAGSARFDGHRRLRARPAARSARLRRRMQIIFQDPYSSLNPRMTVGAAIAEGIEIHRLATGAEIGRRVGGTARGGRARSRIRAALPARVLRRTAAAHRHRPRARGASPRSSSATSRCPRSTCRSRPRSSTCSPTSSASAGSPTSSSRTTSPSSARSPSGWR